MQTVRRLKDVVTEARRQAIEQALDVAQGNVTAAARALGLQRTYLYRLMRELRVAVPTALRAARLATRTAARQAARRQAIATALAQHGDDLTQAARTLRLERPYLRTLIRTLGVPHQNGAR